MAVTQSEGGANAPSTLGQEEGWKEEWLSLEEKGEAGGIERYIVER